MEPTQGPHDNRSEADVTPNNAHKDDAAATVQDDAPPVARPRHHTAPTTTITTPRLYIGNLHPRVTAVHLESLLSKRGLAVEQIHFLRKPGQVAGFCFVTFASTAEAARAVQLLHGRKLVGRALVVQPAHQQQQPAQMSWGGGGSPTNTAAPSARGGETRQKRQLEDQIQAIRQKLQKQKPT